MTYTIAFALTLAMLVHTALWHGPRMWRVVRNQRTEPLDIHAKLMEVYREVPQWWYGIVFLVLFALSIVTIKVFDTDLPVWGLIVALLLPIIYFLPSAFIFATTAQIMTLNLIAQLVPGFLLPGRPIAVMVCYRHDQTGIELMPIAMQDLLAAIAQPGTGLRTGPKARSLHEDSAPINFHRPVLRRSIGMSGTNQCQDPAIRSRSRDVR